MARIPQFQRSSVNILAGASRQTTDLTGLIAGASEATNALARYVERQRAADEAMLKVAVDEAYREKRTEYSTLKGGQARGVSTDYAKNKDALTVDQISDIEDPVTKANMELYVAKSYGQNQEWVTSYQMQQDGVYRAQADEAYRRNLDINLNEATTKDLMPSLDAAVKDATQNFIKMENPDAGSTFNYHKAVTDEFYLKHILQRFKEDPVGMVKWWEENKDVVSKKVSSGVFNTLKDTYEGNEGPAEVMRIYGEVRAKHGNNFLAGAAEIADPKNFKKYGIEEQDYGRANAVATMLRNQHAMNVALNKQQKEDRADQKSLIYNQRTAAIAAEPDVDKRNILYRLLEHDLRTDADMDQADREKRIANLTKANYDLDPIKVRSVKSRIDSGAITRNSQIHAYLGDGIGRDTKELETYLKTKKTFDKAGNGEDYMQRARELFMIEATEQATPEQRRKGKPVLMKGDIERFMLRLEAKRRAENLTKNNPKILDLYDILTTQGAYKMKAGKEERIADTTSMWTANDYLKFKFQTDPEGKVEAEIKLMEEFGNKGEDSSGHQPDTLGTQIDKEVGTKRGFKYRLRNPRMVEGGTIKEKADTLQGEWEAMWGRGMNEEQRTQLESEIAKRFE